MVKTFLSRQNRITISIYVLVTILGAIFWLSLSTPVFAQTVTKTVSSGSFYPGDTVEVTFRVPGQSTSYRQEADIMLVMDKSGSMAEDWFGGPWCIVGDPLAPCKIDFAKDALKAFVAAAHPAYDKIGLVTYAGALGVGGCCDVTLNSPLTTNFAALNTAIDDVDSGGASGTSIGAGVQSGWWELTLSGRGRDDVRDYMVLATDGLQNFGTSVYTGLFPNRPIDLLYIGGVKTFTIGIGANSTRAFGGVCPECTNADDNNGVQHMQSIACFSDADPDTSDPSIPPSSPPWTWNCNWNDSGWDQVDNSVPDSINTRRDPDNYFYALNASDLTPIYETIQDIISGDMGVFLLEQLSGYNPPAENGIFEVDSVTGAVAIDSWNVYEVDEPTQLCEDLGRVDITGGFTEYQDWPAYSASPPDTTLPTYRGYIISGGTVPGSPPSWTGMTANFGNIGGTKANCLIVRVTVADGASPGPGQNVDHEESGFGGDQLCYLVYQDLQGDLILPPAECTLPTVGIESSADEWIETTGGDVGSRGDIDVARDPTAVPLPAGRYNSNYLVILDQGKSIAGNRFNSAKSWLVPNYQGNINLTLNNYQEFLVKYGPVEATVTGNTLNGGQIESTLDDNGGVMLWDGDITGNAAFNYNCATCDPAVVFVDGNMTINNDLTVGTQKGLVFIVSGNITIGSSVTNLGGFYIANGSFDSGDSGTQLTVNGGVIAFGNDILGDPLVLGRDFEDNLCSAGLCNEEDPAELFIYQPKYLWLFRQLLGTIESTFEELGP